MKKKFLSKKHMAVLLSAALAAGSLSFVPAEYEGLSMVHAQEESEETATPAFAEDNPTIMTSGDEGALKITGLEAGSTVTWTSDNKGVIDFVTEGAEEKQEEAEEATAETTVEAEATETTVKVKAGVAGKATITATVKEKAEAEAAQEQEGESTPLTCEITVNFKLEGVEEGNVNLDLKENKTAEIMVSGIAEGTELEWSSSLPAKEDPEKPDEEGEPEAPKAEDVATVTVEENNTTKATVTAVAVGEINVTVAVKEEAEEVQSDEAQTESWKQQTFTVKVTEGQTEDPTPEQPGPEQPTPEQPAPEQPAPEQPKPEQPGGDTGTNTPAAVSGITLSQTEISLNKGKTAVLTATVAPENAADKTVIWSSSNEKVATVSDGTVTAVSKGTATVTAKAGDKTATCTVTVKVPASKVTLNTKQIYMVKGKSVNVKATVTPSDTTDRTSWSTSNKKVATVKNGKISAKKTGKATVTVKAGSKKATVKVNVVSKAKKATKVTLNKKKATLKVKKTLSLKTTLKPSSSTDTLKWTSSNKKVAKVDKFGTVTAVKKGKATITVKTSSGKKATCKITVK
ncbi:hypothetical protein C805_00259 [Eubacterium sp. 14-2]|uniref:Ig-like domain-containing protein n=1 Tax=Eubacterium sp. 14-2 TaxID=1235790 RepID=UPI000340FA56|nr:Ig-like domain-containing protein [Eubacterium sp. 14-2]EOT28738.1 hypothetical protein C805_00259 [Eubacterium sp. 14-2]